MYMFVRSYRNPIKIIYIYICYKETLSYMSYMFHEIIILDHILQSVLFQKDTFCKYKKTVVSISLVQNTGKETISNWDKKWYNLSWITMRVHLTDIYVH